MNTKFESLRDAEHIFPIEEIVKQLGHLKNIPIQYFIAHDLDFNDEEVYCILYKIQDNVIEVIDSYKSKNKEEIENIIKYLKIFFNANVVELKRDV